VDSAAAFAKAHGIPRWHGSYQALLDDPELDALYIPLPNSLHREWTIRAVEKKKHVLCEKPLAATAAECREMHAAAESNGVKLMEAFMYRFHPRTVRLLELAKSGTIGELRAIRSVFTFRLTKPENIRLNAALAGGSLMDVGCYCVNISRTVAGEPVEAQAFATFGPSGVDVQLAGSLRFENGVVAQVESALTIERRQSYEIAGSEATLVAENAFVPGTDPSAILERHGKEPEVRHDFPGADQYRVMVEHFADCALHDRPLRYTALEAAGNMAAIEALYASARAAGKPLAVPR
jgi:D-xylose 1-dehydrogenase (NADP+, D-xylono-1,5-lactone-forming)